jgi:hypothetical protein
VKVDSVQKIKTLYKKIATAKRAGSVAQKAECLPIKYNALS